jgi:hypothetical protein
MTQLQVEKDKGAAAQKSVHCRVSERGNPLADDRQRALKMFEKCPLPGLLLP